LLSLNSLNALPINHLSELSSYGGSVVLKAEGLYEEHAPTRAVLLSNFARLWTGSDPAEIDPADPAKAIPGHGMEEFEPRHDHHKKDRVVFSKKDITAWTVFTLVFFVLLIFDNFILHRKAEKLTLLQSILYTTFWIAVAGMFNLYIFYTRGASDAFSWGTGYLLEWMLSVDNLFVFHRIFIIFKTPDEQKHKPLFYGIVGAIVFRMIFFLIEELLMHHITWMHLVFGLFLIYTGYKAVSMDDDDDSPDQGWVYQYLVSHINYVDRYDDNGKFFTNVLVDEATGQIVESPHLIIPRTPPRSPREVALAAKNGKISSPGSKNTTPRIDEASLPPGVIVQCRATRLLLVVVCLEVTDLVFAVDSVSAIVAQIPDLFLAYTACVFAMLGLRAMFFAIDELVKMFSLLAYGVAFILIFIGLKLILRSWIHIPPRIVCFILVSTLAFSVFASLIADKFYPDDESETSETDCPEDTERAVRA